MQYSYALVRMIKIYFLWFSLLGSFFNKIVAFFIESIVLTTMKNREY
jgi:hypothetical protein